MNKLFGDLKTDEEKSNFFLSGRGYETGVIAAAIQNDVAMAYHRCVEYKKELAALQAPRTEAVQGEPVAVMYEDGSVLSKADCGDNFEFCCKVLTPLYTAPQPAEQQPTPDVTQLVEALTMARETIVYALRANAPDYFTTDADIAWYAVIQRIDAALAAYRKGGCDMSNDKMRDEFDSWIEKQGMSTMKDGETYYHHVTHAAWQAWKASRAAPAVQGEPDTHSFLEYPSFEESANFDPVPAVQGDPVGEAGSLPGTSGFTTAVFESRKVPVGTKLYAAPQPVEQQPDVTQLVEALEEGLRAIGDHHAPDDCYATGPMTGDPFRDLVQCPACSFIAMCDDLLAAHRKQGGRP